MYLTGVCLFQALLLYYENIEVYHLVSTKQDHCSLGTEKTENRTFQGSENGPE